MEKNVCLFQDNALTEAKYDFSSLEKNIMYSVMKELTARDLEVKKRFYHEIVNRLFALDKFLRFRMAHITNHKYLKAQCLRESDSGWRVTA